MPLSVQMITDNITFVSEDERQVERNEDKVRSGQEFANLFLFNTISTKIVLLFEG